MTATAENRESTVRQLSEWSGRLNVHGYTKLTGRSWPAVRIRHDARKRPHGNHSRDRSFRRLYFRLLGDFQRVIDLDSEVSDGAFQLGMSKQQLNGAQVLGTLVDQGGFGAPHRVRPVGR